MARSLLTELADVSVPNHYIDHHRKDSMQQPLYRSPRSAQVTPIQPGALAEDTFIGQHHVKLLEDQSEAA